MKKTFARKRRAVNSVRSSAQSMEIVLYEAVNSVSRQPLILTPLQKVLKT